MEQAALTLPPYPYFLWGPFVLQAHVHSGLHVHPSTPQLHPFLHRSQGSKSIRTCGIYIGYNGRIRRFKVFQGG